MVLEDGSAEGANGFARYEIAHLNMRLISGRMKNDSGDSILKISCLTLKSLIINF
jgi:hypothetical protein